MPSNKPSAAAEEALRQYGAPSVVLEYEQLSVPEKVKLLEAMVTGQRDVFVQTNVMKTTENTKSTKIAVNKITNATNKKKSKGKAKKSNSCVCPLARALCELGANAKHLEDNDDVLDTCRNNLRTWGDTEGESYFMTLFRYQQKVAYLKQCVDYQKKKDGSFFPSITNASVIKPGSNATATWDKLKKIEIQDLTLFGTSWKCFLEGKIIGEAILPIVGGTVLIQDSSDNVLLVCFYNLLPEGVRGVDAEILLQEKFPMGATIRVVEPFLKIFRDGSRGIRVDNPADIEVETMTTKLEISNASLEAKKNQGNEFVKKKQYSAAMEVYIGALNATEFVPTVLSNRCQAYISLQSWDHALLDAAASLTIQPKSTKTWDRYKLCLSKLNDCYNGDKQKILEKIATSLTNPTSKPVCSTMDMSLAKKWKEKGNESFRNKVYDESIDYYTKALIAAGGTVRALLNNWALCALEVESLNDVIASASAALRIGLDDKALYRFCKGLCYLGEHKIAISVLDSLPKSENIQQLYDDSKIAELFLLNKWINPCIWLNGVPSLISTWIGPVETYMTNKMGRGLRALRDIAQGELILIDRALASACASVSDGSHSVTHNTYDRRATTKMKADLVQRCQRDAVLSRILSHLSDGTTGKPLVPLRLLMRTVDSCPVLLPGHFDYVNDEGLKISSEEIQSIVGINIHGTHGKLDKDESSLLALVATMNHSRKANCSFLFDLSPEPNMSVVVASKPIPKGFELFMKYHDDEVKAAEKWKF
jgi:tetratricopeptide (TPR) repeat protein